MYRIIFCNDQNILSVLLPYVSLLSDWLRKQENNFYGKAKRRRAGPGCLLQLQLDELFVVFTQYHYRHSVLRHHISMTLNINSKNIKCVLKSKVIMLPKLHDFWNLWGRICSSDFFDFCEFLPLWPIPSQSKDICLLHLSTILSTLGCSHLPIRKLLSLFGITCSY